MRLFVTDPNLCNEIVDLMKAQNKQKAVFGMTGLTRKQRALYEFIRDYVAANHGVPPSFDEMKDAIGLASKSGVHRLINSIEERGYISRLPNRARAIMLLDKPEIVKGEAA